ncbi:MAG: hypothetical protein QM680_12880 [Luteolibacter sp.]
MKTRALCCLLTLTVVLSLSAQTSSSSPAAEVSASYQDRFLTVVLATGEYNALLARITSISRHKYLLDNTLIVDEVTIDTDGQALARFYHLTPLADASSSSTAKSLSERSQELSEKTGEGANTDVRNMVVKKYPETTHARTIEYRLLSTSQLDTLFNGAKTAWQLGKGKKLTIK